MRCYHRQFWGREVNSDCHPLQEDWTAFDCLCPFSWGRGWEAASPEAVRQRVTNATAADAWVRDGNFDAVRDVVWARVGHRNFAGCACRPSPRWPDCARHLRRQHSPHVRPGNFRPPASGFIRRGGSSEMAALTACTDAARTANTAASQTKRKGPARGGTCSLSGYARTLRYDSGWIERIPLFFSK